MSNPTQTIDRMHIPQVLQFQFKFKFELEPVRALTTVGARLAAARETCSSARYVLTINTIYLYLYPIIKSKGFLVLRFVPVSSGTGVIRFLARYGLWPRHKKKQSAHLCCLALLSMTQPLPCRVRHDLLWLHLKLHELENTTQSPLTGASA
jgi:hypothetical protein